VRGGERRYNEVYQQYTVVTWDIYVVEKKCDEKKIITLEH
jgi:hypothetical protein